MRNILINECNNVNSVGFLVEDYSISRKFTISKESVVLHGVHCAGFETPQHVEPRGGVVLDK
jgi:hypothetical protein